MKSIGLLGGMSWESTQDYYRLINEGVKARLGGLHSARIVLLSVDFDPIEKLQHQGDWAAMETLLAEDALHIEAAGAQCLLICTNTMHKLAPQVAAAIQIPLLHIADATAEVLVQKGVRRVGLLGTAFTMEETFYKGRLAERYGMEVLIPAARERQVVHHTIYHELCLGRVEQDSRQAFLQIIDQLAVRGAEVVILGCTEIGLLVSQNDTPVPLLDTTSIHAEAAVRFALKE